MKNLKLKEDQIKKYFLFENEMKFFYFWKDFRIFGKLVLKKVIF